MRDAHITLGHTDLEIRPIGPGCMGMSQFYGDADERESIATVHVRGEQYGTLTVRSR